MHSISLVVLILLSFAGYSAGATIRAGKSAELKPHIVDLILVVIIWTCAITSRLILDINKWLLVFIWMILSTLIGFVSFWPRKISVTKTSTNKIERSLSQNFLKNLWRSWQNFSKRMGSFQSRIILSLFYFIFVSPFALIIKLHSDPLKIKRYNGNSHWLSRKETANDLEQYRRQF